MFQPSPAVAATRMTWQNRMDWAARRAPLPGNVSLTVRRLLHGDPGIPTPALIEAVRAVHGPDILSGTVTAAARRARTKP